MERPKFHLLLILVLLFFSFVPLEDGPGTHKLILFEGSDWCINCIRLEKNVLSEEAFVNFMKRREIEIERIDFPQRKKLDPLTRDYNASMAEKYGFKGKFPTLLLVKSETGEVIRINYSDQGVSEFIAAIESKIAP
ncbi:hypothetical protein [Spongiimicrobium sp. 2-473A-2-J]|uniref:hypothetical protein n=1 Tax=Eudoraea algarum TaxID=3417568 RepID=UPI003D36CED2